MKDLRIEITDKGTALYLAADPDGVWAKTTRPHDLVTIDWDAQGRVIGIEAIGSAARNAISACIAALRRLPTEDPALYSALDAVTGETPSEPPYNPQFMEFVTAVEPEALHRGIDVIVEKAASGLEPSFEEFKGIVLAGGSVAAGSLAGESIFADLRSADAETAGSKTPQR